LARERVLSDDELHDVWNAAGGLGYPFAGCIQILILTVSRREEVAGMCWSEIAPDLSAWTIPAARAKNGKAQIVHMSEPARAILRTLPRMANQDLIFSTNGKTAVSGFSKAKLRLDAALVAKCEKDAAASSGEVTPIPPWVFHDFRRTAVTWLAGAGGFPPHIADRLLNHVGGTISGVAAVYQRNQFLAERAAALDAWGAHVTGGVDRG
jgi:integrase